MRNYIIAVALALVAFGAVTHSERADAQQTLCSLNPPTPCENLSAVDIAEQAYAGCSASVPPSQFNQCMYDSAQELYTEVVSELSEVHTAMLVNLGTWDYAEICSNTSYYDQMCSTYYSVVQFALRQEWSLDFFGDMMNTYQP